MRGIVLLFLPLSITMFSKMYETELDESDHRWIRCVRQFRLHLNSVKLCGWIRAIPLSTGRIIGSQVIKDSKMLEQTEGLFRK